MNNRVSFSELGTTACYKKILNYIKRKVTFKKLAKASGLPYSDLHNFSCWFHGPDDTPSARVRKKGTYESYYCFTENISGDVVWAFGKLEDLDSIPEIVDAMDEYFGLNLEEHIPEILGEKRGPLTVAEKFYNMDRAELLPLENELSGVLNKVSLEARLRVEGECMDIWVRREELQYMVLGGEVFDRVLLRAAEWVGDVGTLLVRLQILDLESEIEPLYLEAAECLGVV